MTTLTIELTEDEAKQLQQQAERAGISPEALVRAAVQPLLESAQDKTFEEAMAYVLEKNHELYQRLA